MRRTKTGLAIRSEGGSEQVVAEISFVSSSKMITRANCHHVHEKLPNMHLPRTQPIRGLDMSSSRGVNPGGLFVRRERSGAKNAMVMLVAHGNHSETQGTRKFYTCSPPEE
jgi:hypothetical protein